MMMGETRKQKRRTAWLVVALVLLVAIIYAATFIKLPVWLPALK
jgi:hypothetical protein